MKEPDLNPSPQTHALYTTNRSGAQRERCSHVKQTSPHFSVVSHLTTCSPGIASKPLRCLDPVASLYQLPPFHFRTITPKCAECVGGWGRTRHGDYVKTGRINEKGKKGTGSRDTLTLEPRDRYIRGLKERTNRKFLSWAWMTSISSVKEGSQCWDLGRRRLAVCPLQSSYLAIQRRWSG